ncbi:MAG TPA: hypothetical protein VFN91_18400 [Myxococcaceae bacterium]|nr:hypothetical protein [Myxococcaceae bacterium]
MKLLVAAGLAFGWGDDDRCGWDQWGGSAAHDGQACARAQPQRRELAHIVYDKWEFLELAEGFGDLFVHYQVPLTDDDGNVFMMSKAGTYTPCDPPGSFEPFPCGFDPANIVQEVWTEKAWRWGHDGKLHERWTFESDWKPYPVTFWEPMFQPALWGPFLYVPGAGGTVFQVLKSNGKPIQRINPFGSVDPNTYVSGGITVDRHGVLYWNVVRIDPFTFAETGYLVRATPWGRTKVVAYDGLFPDAPRPGDLCSYAFTFQFPRPPRPWPPPGATPPQLPCGGQRAGINVTPAVGPDGTVFSATTDSLNPRYSYLVAFHPDLELRWSTSLRGIVHDGCGVLVPPTPLVCPVAADGTPLFEPGVDPNTGLQPQMQVNDTSSSSPVALPDGNVLYGALDGYNFGRGHLLKLDRSGKLLATYPFGWDTTPALYRHHGTYSIVMKDNHYFDQNAEGGPFFITQLSKDLEVEWQFRNTETQACTRLPDGTLSCSDTTPEGETHPNGFEWCVNAPVVDRDGNVHANAEDGFAYVIKQGGVLKERTFLNQALGAAYTPTSIDPEGRIYVLNNGELSVLGR